MPAETDGDTGWVLDRARRLATDVLGPAAMTVEATQRVPREHLDLLATAGFYGLAGPRSAGGLDLPLPTFCRVIEILASGCLSTTFIWLQQHSAVRAIAGPVPAALRAELLGPLCRGTRRAGLALAGTLPGPPRLRARSVPGGYRLDGSSPWVTGWGHIDLLYTAARDEQDDIVWAVLDAQAGGTLSAQPLPMVAVMASATVELRFDGHFVPAGRVTGTMSQSAWQQRDRGALRPNGSLALGLAARCCELVGPGPLDAQLDTCRAALDSAGPDRLPAARAAAAELAVRAASALVVTAGSAAIRLDHDAQRLAARRCSCSCSAPGQPSGSRWAAC